MESTNISNQVELSSSKKRLLLLIKGLILIGIFYYLIAVKEIDFSEVLNNLSYIPIWEVVLLLMLFLAIEFIQAPMIAILMKPYKAGIYSFQIYLINISSMFYSMFLFGALGGGIFRWYRFSQFTQKKSEAFTVLVIQRILFTLTLFTFAALIIVLDNPFGEENKPYLMVISITLISLITFILFMMTHPSVLTIIDEKLANPLLLKLPSSISEKLRSVWTAITDYKGKHKTLLLAFLNSIVYRLATLFFYYILAQVINMDLGFLEIAVFFVGSSLAEYFPSLFAGVAERTIILITLGEYYSVPKETMLLYSALIFAFIFLSGTIGGLLEIYYHFVRQRKSGQAME